MNTASGEDASEKGTSLEPPSEAQQQPAPPSPTSATTADSVVVQGGVIYYDEYSKTTRICFVYSYPHEFRMHDMNYEDVITAKGEMHERFIELLRGVTEELQRSIVARMFSL